MVYGYGNVQEHVASEGREEQRDNCKKMREDARRYGYVLVECPNLGKLNAERTYLLSLSSF